MSEYRANACAVAVGHHIWVMGGMHQKGSIDHHVNYLDSVEIFDTVAGTWKPGPLMNDSHYKGFAALLSPHELCVIGGVGSFEIETIDPHGALHWQQGFLLDESLDEDDVEQSHSEITSALECRHTSFAVATF